MTTAAYMPQAKSVEWTTPQFLFDALWAQYGGFDCDPACQPDQYTAKRVLENRGIIHIPPHLHSTVKPEYLGRIMANGLEHHWEGKVFMNPPYGRGINEWVAKAVREVADGHARLVVALLPVRTDTHWWQQHVISRAHRDQGVLSTGLLEEVDFLAGRLRFGTQKNPAPFPSAVVVWRG